jgi:acetylornithine deacetylase
MTDDVVALTEELVRVDTSPGHSTAALAGTLAERLRRAGAAVSLQDGEADGVTHLNLLARFGGDAPAGLILAGHMDTVPWQPDFLATTTPARDGRRLYGRGACDMKGPIAAQLLAAEAAARGARALRRPLALAYTFAEETGCDGAIALMAGRTRLGDVTGAVCLVGEPTGLAPMVGHKGYWIAHLRLTGVPAHSSRPKLGADASRALALLLEELHALRDRLATTSRAPGFEPPETTLNTGLVSAGLARNIIPDRAEVVIELRPVPGADGGALRREVAGCVERATAAVPGVSGTVEWIETMPAFGQDRAAPLIDWLVQRTGHAAGVIPFYTEAELYRAGLGVPTAVCGPGSIDMAHRVDESILFDELEAGQRFYAEAIAAFCD